MSVPKHRRNPSRAEFEATFFKVFDSIVDVATHKFYIPEEVYNKYKLYIDSQCTELLCTANRIQRCIRIANSIYPQDMSEYRARREMQTKAIGLCYSLLTTYQLLMHYLCIEEDKHMEEVDSVIHLINSLKNWRKSDNRLKKSLEDK